MTYATEQSEDYVQQGGLLFFNSEGIAGCPRCGWRGVPTYVGGKRDLSKPRRHFGPDTAPGYPVSGSQRSTFCPSCESDEADLLAEIQLQTQRRVEKIGRNEPCPCGSGRKYKKCCGA